MITLLSSAAALIVGFQTPTIDQFVQKNLDDATFKAKVLKADQRELAKINEDFGQSYRFDTTTIRFKEPFKLRIEANVEDTTVLYILNGPIQTIRVPRVKINQRVDLSGKPGRRQTPLDFGLLTPSLFPTLFTAKYVRKDRSTGEQVFDLTYTPPLKDRTRMRIWIDESKKYITKREWYNQRGNQIATFFYEEAQQKDGVWMPTKLTVKNTDNKVAGITGYTDLKVNTGLEDGLFSN